jgi:PAS domain S-box-containing protein
MDSSDVSSEREKVRLAVEQIVPPGTPVSADEVAGELGCTQSAARCHLEQLGDRGDLEAKTVGGGVRVWWQSASTDEAAGHAAEGDRSFVADALADVEVGVFVLNDDFEVEWVNRTVERYFGLDRADVVGADKRRLARERIADAVADSTAFADATLRTYDDNSYEESFECRVLPGEGREARWLEHRSKPIESGAYAGGRVELYYDVTDHKESNEQLRGEEAFTESILENQRDLVYAFDARGNLLRWNDRLEAVTGYDSEAIAEMQPTDFIAEDSRDEAAAVVSRTIESGESETVELPLRTADGERIPYEFSGAPLTDDGTVVGVTGIGRDVSERRTRERQLRRDRNRLQRILEANPAALAIFDASGELIEANAPAESALGATPDGEYVAGSAHCLDAEGRVLPFEERPVGRTLATGEPVIDREIRLAPSADADARWYSVTTMPICDDDGTLEQIAMSAEDVTRLKRQARRLERQRDDLESELNGVFERIDDAFYGLDDEFRFTFVNESAERLLDRPESELLGVRLWDAFPGIGETEIGANYERAMATQEPVTFEEHYPPLDAWFEVRVYPSDTGLSVYFRDVTARKEHEQKLERYRTVVETLNDGVYALDPDERFAMANGAFLEMVGYEREELLGEPVSITYGEGIVDELTTMTAEIAAGEREVGVLEHGLRTQDGGEIAVETRFGPYEYDEERYAHTGVCRDVTDRKQFEETLTSLHAATRELFSSETDREVSRVVHEAVADVLGVPGAAVYRYDPVRELMLPSVQSMDAAFMDERFPELPVDDSITGRVFEAGESRYYENLADVPHLYVDASSTQMRTGAFVPMDEHVLVVGARSVDAFDEDTRQLLDLVAANAEAAYEHVERGGQLEQYRTLTQAAYDVILTVDEESTILSANPVIESMFGYPPDEIEGEPLTAVIRPDDADRHLEEFNEYLRTGRRSLDWEYLELEAQHRDGTPVPIAVSFNEVTYGGRQYFVGIIRDITERKEYERELRERIHQQEAVGDLGQRALARRDVDALFDEASARVADTLDAEFCEILELDDEGGELLLRAGVGWREDAVGEVPAGQRATQAGYTLSMDEPVLVEDLATEPRFGDADYQTEHGVRSGITVTVGPLDDPWGVLGVHHTTAGQFSERDVAFVQSIANVLTTAIERNANEQRLVDQREQLRALNNLNEVVRRITEAVVDRSTREEIEQVVCERLAAADSYEFAWIGEVDAQSATVEARAEAGVEGYLDEMTVSVDADGSRSRGLAGRALHTREMQVVNDVFDALRFEPWRGAAREYGYRSVAAIPIVHGGTLYGLLGVYADRPEAFTGDEQRVLGQLGEVVGHAIAAAERKRALVSDEVVEVEFRIPRVFEAFDADVATDGRIALDRTVPIGDGEYLMYGTAAPDAVDGVRGLVEALPHWTAVSFIDEEREDDRRFELRLAEPPALEAVIAQRGSIEKGIIENRDYRIVLQFSPGVDVREIIDVVEESYPSAEMVARRQVTRRNDGPQGPAPLADELTDRQRSTLEIAYHLGYFEWPRDSTAEDVADSLGVSSPTVHKHLRRAQRKVFSEVVDEN